MEAGSGRYSAQLPYFQVYQRRFAGQFGRMLPAAVKHLTPPQPPQYTGMNPIEYGERIKEWRIEAVAYLIHLIESGAEGIHLDGSDNAYIEADWLDDLHPSAIAFLQQLGLLSSSPVPVPDPTTKQPTQVMGYQVPISKSRQQLQTFSQGRVLPRWAAQQGRNFLQGVFEPMWQSALRGTLAPLPNAAQNRVPD